MSDLTYLTHVRHPGVIFSVETSDVENVDGRWLWIKFLASSEEDYIEMLEDEEIYYNPATQFACIARRRLVRANDMLVVAAIAAL